MMATTKLPLAVTLLSLVAGCAAEPPPPAPPPAAPPPRPRAAEIMATIPEKAGTIKLDGDVVVTIDAAGRVVIDDPHGKHGGSSSCGFNGFEYRKSVQLFAELQDALRAGERARVAQLVIYPLRINEGAGKHHLLNDSEALLHDFEKLFTDKTTREILAAEPRAIFCRSDAFMIGNGPIWGGAAQNGRYGIIAVNL